MTDTEQSATEARSGVFFGLGAYVLWGVFPVYFKLIETVAPTEILAHRIVWAVPFGVLILFIRRQWSEVACAFRHPGMMWRLSLAALCISLNWLIYIWGVVNERIFETSLGYYINPLIYVLVGVVFFGERLRRLQLAAVMLAAIGVLVLIVQGGIFPWVSLSLAILFTAYGVIRKQVAIGAMPGLFVETTVLFPLALGWLAWLMFAQQAAFTGTGGPSDMLLLLAGPVTVFPLLFFAIAARRVTLLRRGTDNGAPDLFRLHLDRSGVLQRGCTAGRPRATPVAKKLIAIFATKKSPGLCRGFVLSSLRRAYSSTFSPGAPALP